MINHLNKNNQYRREGMIIKEMKMILIIMKSIKAMMNKMMKMIIKVMHYLKNMKILWKNQ